ncbi:MAG: radical SAM protein [Actinobacteria bacterium]|nr:radical SAM protein [Actinomycetota bacterium]
MVSSVSDVVTRRYVVRTFGCQMNEHDSERIAGLLEHDGLEPAESEAEADIVVFNTCCIRSLAATGVSEIFLLGQNVNSYGRDLSLASRRAGDADVRVAPQFAALLRAVGEVPGVRRVRYMSPHPKDMREDTLLAMAETAAVCEHLHYPLQSGSDSVLAAMHRGYTAQRYLERLAQARATIGDLAVTTDVIVGFPGETEADFAATMEVAGPPQFRHGLPTRDVETRPR